MAQECKIAQFIYYGECTEKDREVQLWSVGDGTYTVRIQGMPTLTRKGLPYEKAVELLEGYTELSKKDYDCSEIEWFGASDSSGVESWESRSDVEASESREE